MKRTICDRGKGKDSAKSALYMSILFVLTYKIKVEMRNRWCLSRKRLARRVVISRETPFNKLTSQSANATQYGEIS